MKFKRKLSNFFLTIFGFIVMLAFPFSFVYNRIMVDNFNVMPDLNFSFIIWLVVAVVAAAIGGVYLKWIKKIWDRKLQAIAVIKEFETVPDKAVVLTRILRSFEYIYPLLILLSLLHSVTFLSISFVTLRNINLFLVAGLGMMEVVFLIRDIIDNHYKNEIRISGMEEDELKKERKYLKRLEKGIDEETGLVSAKNQKLLDIKKKIKEIEDNNLNAEN